MQRCLKKVTRRTVVKAKVYLILLSCTIDEGHIPFDRMLKYINHKPLLGYIFDYFHKMN